MQIAFLFVQPLVFPTKQWKVQSLQSAIYDCVDQKNAHFSCFDLTEKSQYGGPTALGYFESNNSGIKVHLLQ